MDLLKTSVNQALPVLRKGGIILYPTDTIWGIGCDATKCDAIKRIYGLKNREEKKSLIILAEDIDMLTQYVSRPSPILLSYLSSAQKPTTAIFKNAINLPGSLINEDGSIAIRIPKDDFCIRLIQQFQKPLVSTSANVSSEKSPQNFEEISDEIKNGVDYIVQHRQNDFSKSTPSSIIRLNEKDEIEFIRD